ncbi:hypothetical protein BKA64DRAFT_207235 [Cadophora sp. MPI-SDFR-AT-0126]|nr:hypothetical protein BKA64DRAFT_207235 [Leotiomycetes sp. MPI-SDFR-AT-0126]
MMVLVHIQVRKTGTDWSVADTIAFGPALSLSLIALGVCIARLSGCYSPKTRWSQLGICFISTALALCMVGLVSSRRYGDQKLARVYFGLLLPNCVCPGLYEVNCSKLGIYRSSHLTGRVHVERFVSLEDSEDSAQCGNCAVSYRSWTFYVGNHEERSSPVGYRDFPGHHVLILCGCIGHIQLSPVRS